MLDKAGAYGAIEMRSSNSLDFYVMAAVALATRQVMLMNRPLQYPVKPNHSLIRVAEAIDETFLPKNGIRLGTERHSPLDLRPPSKRREAPLARSIRSEIGRRHFPHPHLS